MARMVPPTGVKEVAIQTPRGEKIYRADHKGFINVENSSHAAQMKYEGLGVASLTGATTDPNAGYTCNSCGFGSWFKKCSKCGIVNERIEMDGSSG